MLGFVALLGAAAGAAVHCAWRTDSCVTDKCPAEDVCAANSPIKGLQRVMDAEHLCCPAAQIPQGGKCHRQGKFDFQCCDAAQKLCGAACCDGDAKCGRQA